MFTGILLAIALTVWGVLTPTAVMELVEAGVRLEFQREQVTFKGMYIPTERRAIVQVPDSNLVLRELGNAWYHNHREELKDIVLKETEAAAQAGNEQAKIFMCFYQTKTCQGDYPHQTSVADWEIFGAWLQFREHMPRSLVPVYARMINARYLP